MLKFVLFLICASVLLAQVHSHPISGNEADSSDVSPEKKGEAAVKSEEKEESTLELVKKEETAVEPEKKEETAVEPEKQEETAVEPAKKEETEVEPEKKVETAVEPEKKEEIAVEPEKKVETAVKPEKKEETAVEPAKKDETVVVPEKEVETAAKADKLEETAVDPAKKEETAVEPEKKEETAVEPEKDVETAVKPEKKAETAADPEKKEETPVTSEKKEETVAIPEKKEETVKAPGETDTGKTKDAADAPVETGDALVKTKETDETVETPVIPAAEKESAQKTPEVTFAVPDVPNLLENSEYGTSRLLNIWSNRLFQYHKSGGILRDSTERPAPLTILVAKETVMLNLVPQDAPNPLYSDEFTTLTDDFLLDSMSTTYVNPDDEKLVTPEGVTVKTGTGKDLIFKKDPKTNTLTVNGIAIAKYQKIVSGDTRMIVFDIDDILFDYREEIDSAFKTLSKKTKQSIAPKSP